MITIILSKFKSFFQDTDIRMMPNGSIIKNTLSLPSVENVRREMHAQYVSNICALHLVYERLATIASMKSGRKFVQPVLTQEEMRDGCRLGLDSFVDTCCTGRHA